MRNKDVDKLVSDLAKVSAHHVHTMLLELVADGVLTSAQAVSAREKYVVVVTRAA